ncbi:hypothetical protein CC_2116 [Caulobacter vibrioides CB15]|uniref:Uncharacterized protein n=1 Tax=Caulobacter vibrioides (strain ATCC 19089 / CIP 103742 / CB 15) TaxID=190650 RepID=Q9A6H8_CAUVC|nr:hypothetical protein CC_2116 [Caulobacter vibrioides CB15]
MTGRTASRDDRLAARNRVLILRRLARRRESHDGAEHHDAPANLSTHRPPLQAGSTTCGRPARPP